MAKLNTVTTLDVTNKMSLSVGSSTNDKNYFEELYPWAPQLQASDIFAEVIPYAVDPTAADNNVATNPTMLVKLVDYRMDEMPASNGQGFGCYTIPGDNTSELLKDFVLPQKFGPGYGFTLKDGDGVTIPLTGGSYQFDYANGFLRFNDANTPITEGWLPLTNGYMTITVYRYIGTKLDSGTGGGDTNPRLPVSYLDAVSLAKPTVDPTTIDAGTNPVLDGDHVLFTALAGAELADDNRVWIADTTTTPGTILWTLRPDGKASDGVPTAGDHILITGDGSNSENNIVSFDGVEWVKTSGGAFNLTVEEDDGVPSGGNIDKIVMCKSTSDNVYIDGTTAYLHAPEPPIPFTGTDLMSNKTFITGRLSQNNINYKVGDPAGSIVNYIINITDSNMVFTHNNNAYQAADVGITTFSVNTLPERSIDMAANFNEVNRNGSQIITDYDIQGTGDPVTDGVSFFTTNTDGALIIDSVNWTGNIGASPYQKATCHVSILAPTWWRQGYSGCELSHNASTTNMFDVFVDTNPLGVNDPSVVTPSTLVLNTGVLRWLSGVPYYDTGTTFDFSCVVNNGFDNVYHVSNAPVVLSGFPGVVSAGLVYTDASVTGVTTPPTISDVMTVTNFLFTVPVGQEDNDVQVTATPRDPYGSYVSVNTTSNNYSVNSLHTPVSTVTYDYWTDEDYRFPANTNFDVVPASLTGNWDSTISLSSGTSGYTTSLQVYDEDNTTTLCLRHPAIDYTFATASRNPNGPDYTGEASGTNYVYYRIYQGVIDNSNGILDVPGITDADLISGDVKIEIKVPSKTVWLDMTSDFNGGTFPVGANIIGGTDGEGCRINPGVHSPNLDGTLEFSLGTYASDTAVNRTMFIRVTYADNTTSKILTGFGVQNW